MAPIGMWKIPRMLLASLLTLSWATLAAPSARAQASGSCDPRLSSATEIIVPFGRSTFRDTENQWISIALRGQPGVGRTAYESLTVAIGGPLTHSVEVIEAVFDRENSNLFSLDRTVVFRTQTGTDSVQVTLHYNQRAYMVEPSLRQLGVPVTRITLDRFSQGKPMSTRSLLLFQDLPWHPTPTSDLTLEGSPALDFVTAVSGAGVFVESLGFTIDWARSPTSAVTLHRSMTLAQAGPIARALLQALERDHISPQHAAFRFPPIAAAVQLIYQPRR